MRDRSSKIPQDFILHVNGEVKQVYVTGDMPLLWVLRDELGITGVKYSCGIGQCGACSVFIGGKLRRSCLLPISSVQEDIQTIEGFGTQDNLHPVQKKWIEKQVAQCGYCQPGQIISAIDLLQNNPTPDAEEIVEAMTSMLCRCATYPRIKKALESLSLENKEEEQKGES